MPDEELKISIERDRLEVEKRRLALEEARLKYEPQRLSFEAETKFGVVSFESTIKFADIAIRSLLVLNGGAALAILSFAAHGFKQEGHSALSQSVLIFGIGAACSVLTAGLAYLAQSLFGHRYNKAGYFAQALGVAVALMSLVAFFAGMMEASRRLGNSAHLQQHPSSLVSAAAISTHHEAAIPKVQLR